MLRPGVREQAESFRGASLAGERDDSQSDLKESKATLFFVLACRDFALEGSSSNAMTEQVRDETQAGLAAKLQRKASALLTRASWLFAVYLAAVWGTIYFGGDRWWPATILLFAPRWIHVAPLAPLVIGALIAKRSLLPLLLVALVVAVGPIMGFRVPWSGWTGRGGRADLRIVTCNVQGVHLDEKALEELIRRHEPDVVLLQECAHRAEISWPAGWNIRRYGFFVIASRFPLRDPRVHLYRWEPAPSATSDAISCTVVSDAGPVSVCNVHLLTPREGLSETLDRRMGINPWKTERLISETKIRRGQNEELMRWMKESGSPSLVGGDFNMPSDSGLYRDFWSPWSNAFDQVGFGLGHTKTTAVGQFAFGSRIDHVLHGAEWTCRGCFVAEDVSSDHRPLVADFQRADSQRGD
ncbi:MAG: endonuclease/exonuclease/phosphatase family protein [Planctomycetales bacterium]